MNHEPLVIEPCVQKDISDCGVACLAMYLGLPYQQVRAHCPRRVGDDGLSNRQMQRVATKLGARLTSVPLGDEAVGILDLQRPADPAKPRGKREGHYAVYIRGVVVNPADGSIWTDLDVFCATRRWTVYGLLVRA